MAQRNVIQLLTADARPIDGSRQADCRRRCILAASEATNEAGVPADALVLES